MFNDRYKYILRTPLGKLELVTDPMGWDDSETEIGRSNKTYGIFLTISNNLQFHGQAFEHLETVYSIYGVQAEVELTKLVKHPTTDEWELGFKGYLDFSTRKIEDFVFKVDFIEGGLREILASQIREKFEINRTESIDGKPLTKFETDFLNISGREIYLLTKWENDGDNFWVRSGHWNSGNDYREVFQAFPIDITTNADPQNLSPQNASNSDDSTDKLSANSMFIFNSVKDFGESKLIFWFGFKITDAEWVRAENVTLEVVIRRWSGIEGAFVLEEEIFIDTVPIIKDANYGIGRTMYFKPETGDSYGIGLKLKGKYGYQFNDGWLDLHITDYYAGMEWSEDSFFDPTTTKFIRGFDLGNRLSEIFTGIPKFKSNLLNQGTWRDLGFACGGWVRNLELKTEEQERLDWPLTISFEDFYKSINAVLPVGYGIANKGAKQFICLESIRYFFQPIVMVKLGQVDKVKRSIADEMVFASLTFGYDQGGNYEQPLGLDEYNVSSTYTTPITVTDKKYEVKGPSRADTYAIEQARRKPYKDYADEDTPYDKDNFLIDAKLIETSPRGDYFEFRLWEDDFEQAPIGVYSPETAGNLRISPANNRTRHSIWFNSATVKYGSQKLRYASTEGNSQLKTKLIGKEEIQESDDVLINTLNNPIFEPEYVEFEVPFNQEILNKLQATTIINGEEINNYYGLIEFINENNQVERGYLFSAKIKDTMKFKLIKSYGF